MLMPPSQKPGSGEQVAVQRGVGFDAGYSQFGEATRILAMACSRVLPWTQILPIRLS